MSESSAEPNEAFALIFDTSSSNAAALEKAWRLADVIYSLVSAEQFKIFLLGSTTPLSPTALRKPPSLALHQVASPCSLVAPIMEVLVQEPQKYSVIVVGNGRIFDLDDWLDDPRIDGWLLVLTGEKPLQGANRRIPEIPAALIESLETDTLRDTFTRLPGAAVVPSSHVDDASIYRWEVDAYGYPLIFVEPLNAYVYLFPVTKPQFERFIASGRLQGMDDNWYEAREAVNPRVSYRSLDIPALERLFITDISTAEAMSFRNWLGRQYALLSAEDWKKCYEWFEEQQQQSVFLPRHLAERLSKDALAIWEIIESHLQDEGKTVNLWQLSLMRHGILEWVMEMPKVYCGLGAPASKKFTRKYSEPYFPLGAEPLRDGMLGFRLRKR